MQRDNDFPEEETRTFEDVMIDIESMSLHPSNALILSVGAIEFNPRAPSALHIGAKMLIVPSIEEQLLLGRRVDQDTQKFWKGQPPEASRHWRESDRATLDNTCVTIHTFLSNAKRVWANGIMFDLTNLDELFRQVQGTQGPWHYRAPRDMRTFCEETPQTRGTPATPLKAWLELADPIVPHHPVSDCIVQAERVWEHWRSAELG